MCTFGTLGVVADKA